MRVITRKMKEKPRIILCESCKALKIMIRISCVRRKNGPIDTVIVISNDYENLTIFDIFAYLF